MIKLRNLIAIAFLSCAIALTNCNLALADAVKSNTVDNTKQAAQEVVKDTGVKQQFGQTEKGDRLLDDAKAKANKKLDNLADKANSEEDLPDSEKLFLKNLQGE